MEYPTILREVGGGGESVLPTFLFLTSSILSTHINYSIKQYMMNNKRYEHNTLSWNPTGKTTNSFLINKMFFYKTVFKLQLDGETFPKFLQLQLKGCFHTPFTSYNWKDAPTPSFTSTNW
jgi:hypothetical protein